MASCPVLNGRDGLLRAAKVAFRLGWCEQPWCRCWSVASLRTSTDDESRFRRWLSLVGRMTPSAIGMTFCRYWILAQPITIAHRLHRRPRRAYLSLPARAAPSPTAKLAATNPDGSCRSCLECHWRRA